MTADLTNNLQLTALRNVGISIPENHGDTYELSFEEEVLLFSECSITTKSDLLSILRVRQNRVSRNPLEALREKITPDAAVELFERVIKVVKENPWNFAPYGFWHFRVDMRKGGIFINLIKDIGHFDEELEYVYDRDDADILIYCIDGKDFSEDRFVSLYTLPETERRVLELSLGMIDGKSKTAEEIADFLGITPEEVLKHKQNAIETLGVKK